MNPVGEARQQAAYNGVPSFPTRASMNIKDLRLAALEYHRAAPAGKLAITATKQLINQRDLALAYSPGVAFACDEIRRDPAEAVNLTARANLIAVITNG